VIQSFNLHQLAVPSKRYRTVLSIAGSDSGGGAGVQADIKTIAALGCYATTAITALTAQNTQGVQAVLPVGTDFLAQQIASVLGDIGADGVKIGMFATLDSLDVIIQAIQRYSLKNIVFDPVMMSSSGASLLLDNFERNQKKDMPKNLIVSKVIRTAGLSTLFTPNLIETEFLLGRPILTLSDMQKAGEEFIQQGLNAVLIKGGHLTQVAEKMEHSSNPVNLKNNIQTKIQNNIERNEPSYKVTDLFLQKNSKSILFESDRIVSRNLHGTGCTLSSAIAAYLAKGLELEDAVRRGRAFLIEALSSGVSINLGEVSDKDPSYAGPLNHGFKPLPTDPK